MKQEIRTICYDEDLRLEAYRLQGLKRPFPNHFHEYYVIGSIEEGRRCLSCKNRDYLLRPGHIIVFNPEDNHACSQLDGGTLDYRAVNIPRDTMLYWTQEITGHKELPGFSQTVIEDQEIGCYLRLLHQMVMEGSGEFEKEEYLLLLLSRLIEVYGRPFENCTPECRSEIEDVCGFIRGHYTEHIDLEQLCQVAALSKSALLRAFTKEKGVTPYRYLETVRIGEAKKLLEQGASPVEAAMQTGFSDQSHFTNYFSRFIGLAPGVYREIFQDRGNRE